MASINVNIIEWDNGLLYEVEGNKNRTTFPDGRFMEGYFRYGDEDRARAISLGYGSDGDAVWQMHRDHDCLHHIVAQAQGFPFSMVLYLLAKGFSAPPGFGNAEERQTLLLARAINLAGGSPWEVAKVLSDAS